MLPNVFIAGAQKSGTTTLCAMLDHHPKVVLSTPKEPAFFSHAASLAHPEQYEACFRSKDGTAPDAIIDGSNAYMVDPLAPSRIRCMLGEDLRFVFCLREPVARAISGYWHQAKKGRERRPLEQAFSFESANVEETVCEEEFRLREAAARGLVDLSDSKQRYDDPMWHFRYFRNSLYAADLQRFWERFGAKRVKVILFQELMTDATEIISELANFLDLDPTLFPDGLACHRNLTMLERVSGVQRLARKLPGRHLLQRLPGYETARGKLLYRVPRAADPLTVERLRRLVLPEIKRLQHLLNRNVVDLWGYDHPPHEDAAGKLKGVFR